MYLRGILPLNHFYMILMNSVYPCSLSLYMQSITSLEIPRRSQHLQSYKTGPGYHGVNRVTPSL